MRIEDIYNPEHPNKGLEIWVGITPIIAAKIRHKVYKNAVLREIPYDNRSELLLYCLKGLDLKANEMIFAIDLLDNNLNLIKNIPLSQTIKKEVEKEILKIEDVLQNGKESEKIFNLATTLMSLNSILPIYEDQSYDILLLKDEELEKDFYEVEKGEELVKDTAYLGQIVINNSQFANYFQGMVSKAMNSTRYEDDDNTE